MANDGNRNPANGAPRPLSLNDKYNRIQVAKGPVDGNSRIGTDPAGARNALRYIDKLLDGGAQAVVGVTDGTRTTTEIPDDQSTGHYVTIFGREYDPDGRVLYLFHDPGTAAATLESAKYATGAFYVDDATGVLFRQGDAPASRYAVKRDYEVTQVRVYKELPP